MTIAENDEPESGLPIDLSAGNGGGIDPESLAPDIRELLKKPGRVLCGDVDIRIDAKGTWFHEGGKISRKELVRLFSRVLRRDDNGEFWMVTPAEVARITVEDAPFMAVELITEGAGEDLTVRFRTNVDDIVTLDDEHPLRVEIDPATGEPRPYIVVRDRLEALITRAAFYQMIEEGDEMDIDGEPVIGVWSEGCFFPLGAVEHAA